MTIDDATTSNPTPFGLDPGAGEARWFGESLQIIKASAATTGGRFALIEGHATEGPAAPLHVHSRESEWWYVLEGELAIWAAGELIDAPAGAFVLGPAGAPHLLGRLPARPVPGRHRAGRSGGVLPGLLGTRDGADPASARSRQAGPGPPRCAGRRVRHRDPRAARYPVLTATRRADLQNEHDSAETHDASSNHQGDG